MRSRWLSKIGLQTLLLGAVPLSFLVALLVLALIVQNKNGAIAAQSERSAQVISESDRDVEIIDEAGRAVVKYQRTHRSDALVPYNSAVSGLSIRLATLRGMVSYDPEQARRARRISADLELGLSILTEYLGYLKSGDTAGEQRLSQSNEVRQLNAELGPTVAAFNENERVSNAGRLRAIHGQVQGFTVALVALCAAGIAITLAVLFIFGLRTTRRIGRLRENARRLAEGLPTRAIGGYDEISELDTVYQNMTARIKREHERASMLQRALLPERLPTFPGLRVDASYMTASGASEIGGDWYDVFPISERRIGISIGDVAGNGLRAAALMATARHAIRSVAYIDDEPAGVMRRTNQIICRNEAGTLVTALFATLDLVDGTLRYCLAGHPAPMLVRTGGSVEELQGTGFLLGVDARWTFKTYTAKLDIGSAIILFTDGVVEARRNYFEGMARLREAIEEEYRNASGNIAQAIQNRALANHPPQDDSAILFIGITALGESALQREQVIWRLDARSEQSARRVKRAVLWHLGEIAGEGSDLSLSELILSEMLGNVARHTPGPAEVTLEWKGDFATVHVYDRGERFVPPVREDVAELLSESGRGIFLMRAMSPEFSVRWTGTGNCVSAVLPLTLSTSGLVLSRRSPDE